MTLAVKVALNLNSTNQPFIEDEYCCNDWIMNLQKDIDIGWAWDLNQQPRVLKSSVQHTVLQWLGSATWNLKLFQFYHVSFTDYVGFIRRCMKQMQKPDYNQARKINIEIEQLDDEDMPLSPGIENSPFLFWTKLQNKFCIMLFLY